MKKIILVLLILFRVCSVFAARTNITIASSNVSFNFKDENAHLYFIINRDQDGIFSIKTPPVFELSYGNLFFGEVKPKGNFKTLLFPTSYEKISLGDVSADYSTPSLNPDYIALTYSADKFDFGIFKKPKAFLVQYKTENLYLGSFISNTPEKELNWENADFQNTWSEFESGGLCARAMAICHERFGAFDFSVFTNVKIDSLLGYSGCVGFNGKISVKPFDFSYAINKSDSILQQFGFNSEHLEFSLTERTDEEPIYGGEYQTAEKQAFICFDFDSFVLKSLSDLEYNEDGELDISTTYSVAISNISLSGTLNRTQGTDYGFENFGFTYKTDFVKLSVKNTEVYMTMYFDIENIHVAITQDKVITISYSFRS